MSGLHNVDVFHEEQFIFLTGFPKNRILASCDLALYFPSSTNSCTLSIIEDRNVPGGEDLEPQPVTKVFYVSRCY